MPDKSPHRHGAKKAGKTIKEKRAVKRSKQQTIDDAADAVSHLKKG
jgi:hypothetical protein